MGDIGATLWVWMGTIGLVLLIACANVAHSLLVRAESRQQELAIRAALGAGGGRIGRELLLESVTLGIRGGGLGLALAYAALPMLAALGPTPFRGWARSVSIEWCWDLRCWFPRSRDWCSV